MKLVTKKIKITKVKLVIAKVLYYIVKLFYRNDRQLVKRQGLNFELDLKEGIDLHLFLFGNFQKHITENKLIKLPADAVIFDVGANVGVLTLIFASKAKNGFVHAFEPTDFALAKFKRNLELNEAVKNRIQVTQTFVSSVSESKSNLKAYSSWPVVSDEEKHHIHRGVDKTTQNIPSITLDEYCEKYKIEKITLIKIDTDGHELEVITGASKALQKYRPQLIFEIGIYIMNERGVSFEDYISFFDKHQYTLYHTDGNLITQSNYTDFIPKFGTIDIIALPIK